MRKQRLMQSYLQNSQRSKRRAVLECIKKISKPLAESTVHQWVGDNIDLNIVSLQGNTAFHAMGIIRVTSPAPATRQHELHTTIPRIKMTVEEKAATLKATEVKILSFVPKKKQDW